MPMWKSIKGSLPYANKSSGHKVLQLQVCLPTPFSFQVLSEWAPPPPWVWPRALDVSSQGRAGLTARQHPPLSSICLVAPATLQSDSAGEDMQIRPKNGLLFSQPGWCVLVGACEDSTSPSGTGHMPPIWGRLWNVKIPNPDKGLFQRKKEGRKEREKEGRREGERVRVRGRERKEREKERKEEKKKENNILLCNCNVSNERNTVISSDKYKYISWHMTPFFMLEMFAGCGWGILFSKKKSMN